MSLSLNAEHELPRKIMMSADAVGGVWSYALELARGLGEKGIALHLVLLGPEPTPSQRAEARAIPSLDMTVTCLPLEWTADRECDLDRVAGHLQDLAGATGADLVHLNAPAHAGTRPWEKPLVITAHSCLGTWWRAVRGGSMPDDMIWRVRRTAQGLARADAVMAPSRSFGEELASTYGAALPLRIVLNGRKPASRHCLAKRHVLTAGRLWDAGKNIRLLDEAAALTRYPVLAAGSVAGPNGERQMFRHLHLLGSLPAWKLSRWYERCAVFASPSHYEPFGLAVLEAAQADAALILADIPSFRELWAGCALFAPPDDARAWAEAITRLCDDESTRKRLAGKARERAESYSAQAMSQETLAVYLEVLSKRRKPLKHAEPVCA